jgi:ribosomal protein L11 methyltransferase
LGQAQAPSPINTGVIFYEKLKSLLFCVLCAFVVLLFVERIIMPWQVVEFPVDAPVAEAAAEALRAAGADGVSEELTRGVTTVRGFWQDADPETVRAETGMALARLVAADLLPAVPPVTLTHMDDQDWLEGWKQYFSPIELSARLAIVPSWEAYDAKPGQAVVTLDPGMAFGTGTHGTTAGCLRALDAYLAPGMAVCDVGTGSGILAIAAVKLGAGRVVATDNDDLAIRVAVENADVNGVTDIDFRVADLLAGIDGPFDLVIANILAPVVLALIPQLPRVLPAGGVFISSGYILSQEAEIHAALEAAGHTVLARYEQEGWVALVSRRG